VVWVAWRIATKQMRGVLYVDMGVLFCMCFMYINLFIENVQEIFYFYG